MAFYFLGQYLGGMRGRGEDGEEGRGGRAGCQGPPERLKSLDVPVSPEADYSPYLSQMMKLKLTFILISLLNLSPNSLPNPLTYFILLALIPLNS